MSKELWWAIAFIVVGFVTVRFILPALGWRREDRQPRPAPPPDDATVAPREDSESPWSKTQRFTEKTVQIPPEDKE